MSRLRHAFSILFLTAAACGGTPNVEPNRIDASRGHADTAAEGGPVAADRSQVARDRAGCACSLDDQHVYTLSWDCYCAAYPCGVTRDSYPVGGWGTYGQTLFIQEYAGCGLVVVTTQLGCDPPRKHVFNLADGRLVGEEQGTDEGASCPYAGSELGGWWLVAGTFPDSSCAVTACRSAPGGEVACGGSQLAADAGHSW